MSAYTGAGIYAERNETGAVQSQSERIILEIIIICGIIQSEVMTNEQSFAR